MALKWGADAGLSLPATLARVTSEPVRVLGEALGSLSSSAGRLVEGGVADVCVFDPEALWPVTPDALCSQGKYTPVRLCRHRHGAARPRAHHIGGRHHRARDALMPGRHVRATWRLARVTVHVFHGVWIAWREFDGASAAHRCARIQWWSARLLMLLGITVRPSGRFQSGPQLLAANHVSWLDIMAVHSVCPQARFVSKADVKAWPLLGWLITQAGTLFIERENKRDALRVVHQAADALREG